MMSQRISFLLLIGIFSTCITHAADNAQTLEKINLLSAYSTTMQNMLGDCLGQGTIDLVLQNQRLRRDVRLLHPILSKATMLIGNVPNKGADQIASKNGLRKAYADFIHEADAKIYRSAAIIEVADFHEIESLVAVSVQRVGTHFGFSDQLARLKVDPEKLDYHLVRLGLPQNLQVLVSEHIFERYPDVEIDLFDRVLLREGGAYGNFVYSEVWHRDGTKIAVGRGKDVVVCDQKTCSEQQIGTHDNEITSIAWHYSGIKIVSGDACGDIKVWHLETGSKQQISSHNGWVRPVAWHPEGTKVAFSDDTRKLKIWDLETGNVQIVGAHNGMVISIAWHSDGKKIDSVSDEDMKVKVWLLPISYKKYVSHLSILQSMYLVHAVKNVGKQQSVSPQAQNYLETVKQTIHPDILERLAWLEKEHA